MKTAIRVLNGSVFVGIILIFLGHPCKGRVCLTYEDPRNINCTSLNRDSPSIEFQLQCTALISGDRYHSCSIWCDLFYRCFREIKKARWKQRWLCTGSQLFGLLISFKTPNGSSSNTTVYVKRERPIRKNLFTIRIVKCNRSSTPTGPGSYTNSLDDPQDSSDDHHSTGISLITIGPPEGFSRSEIPVETFLTALEDIDSGKEKALKNARVLLETSIQDFKNISSSTDKEFEDNVHFTTTAFEDFAIRFAEQQLNDSIAQYDARDEVSDLQVRRLFHQNRTDFSLNDIKGENTVKIPLENFSKYGSVVLGIVYKDLHELFMDRTESNNTNNKSRALNTKIVSALIYPRSEVLQKNITLIFKNLKPAGKHRECVFWNYSGENLESGGWSGEGCHVKKFSSSETVCVCNHLTHFAVLMDFTDDGNSTPLPQAEIDILNILTYVGLALSVVGEVITVTCYVMLTDKYSPLSQIRVSLVTSLLAGQITFLAGIDATEHKGTCVAVAALMQYFFMTALCWMLVEGIYLYFFVVKVFNVADKMSVYHGMSWGTPVVLVAISLSIAAGTDGITSFVSDTHCWLSTSNRLIWIFVSFVLATELVNVLILGRVIKEMVSMEQTKDKQTEQIRLGIKACVVLVPLLGITWLFGLLTPLHRAFVYLFVIVNSFQGFIIFVFHCARNTEIRARLKRRLQARMSNSEKATEVKKSSLANQSAVEEQLTLRDTYELRE